MYWKFEMLNLRNFGILTCYYFSFYLFQDSNHIVYLLHRSFMDLHLVLELRGNLGGKWWDISNVLSILKDCTSIGLSFLLSQVTL